MTTTGWILAAPGRSILRKAETAMADPKTLPKRIRFLLFILAKTEEMGTREDDCPMRVDNFLVAGND